MTEIVIRLIKNLKYLFIGLLVGLSFRPVYNYFDGLSKLRAYDAKIQEFESRYWDTFSVGDKVSPELLEQMKNFPFVYPLRENIVEENVAITFRLEKSPKSLWFYMLVVKGGVIIAKDFETGEIRTLTQEKVKGSNAQDKEKQ